ncbi:MAG: hypothetical protein HY244_15735 [Rhizobiales bacterium]|nr:hypothetical protein [Hyphomicrobiales bacterium]
MAHWLEKVITLLQSDTSDLRELARIAGGNPRTFYREIKLEDIDVTGQNLEGMEFSGKLPPSAIGENQLAFDLPSDTKELPPGQMARKIRGARRQEERAVLLLSEFLRDRSRGMQIIESYAHDTAQLTNSVLRVLTEIGQKEAQGKRFTNLQIARKVSGRFARTVEKRGILSYYLARHLHSYREINIWLRKKSVTGLSKEKQDEFEIFLLGARHR